MKKIGFLLGLCILLYFSGIAQKKESYWNDSLKVLLKKGRDHYKLRKYDSALPLFIQAKQLSDSLNNDDFLASALNNIGLIYMRSDEPEKSLNYFKQVLQIDRRNNNRRGQASTFNNMANVLYRINKLDSSIIYYRKALPVYLEYNDSLSEAGAYNNIASVFYKKNQLDSSYYYFQKSSYIFEQTNAPIKVANLEKNLAFLMIKMQQPQLALNHIEKSKKLAKESGLMNLLPELHIIEGAAQFSLELTDKGFASIDRGEKIRDSLKIVDTDLKLAEQKAKLELKQSEAEKTLIEKQARNRSMAVIVITILLVISFASLILIIQSRRRLNLFNRILQERQKEINQKNQQLTELNATKDRFIQIISHDLKSPIGTLQSFTELLYTDYDLFNDEKRKDIVSNLMKLQSKTYGLLTNLLDWSMLQQGLFKFQPEPLSIFSISEEALAPLNENAVLKKIDLKMIIDESAMIHADKNMTATIFRNLTNNAIKFTHPDGKIVIKTKIENEMIRVCISDNGVGIPQDKQGDLFRIDKKIQTKGTMNEKGTGLGLIIVKEFVEKQGGSIWLESWQDKGSNFYFTIPLYKA